MVPALGEGGLAGRTRWIPGAPRRYGPARLHTALRRRDPDDGNPARPRAPGTFVPGLHSCATAVLGRSRLRDPAALRYGNGRGHLSSGDHAARAWPKTLEGRLRAAVAAAEGWPLWRKSQPVAALLPVSGDHQAIAAEPSGVVSEVACRDRHRFKPA